MENFKRTVLWWLWAISAFTAIGFFFVPAYIIRPFTHQSARGIILAMAVRDRAPAEALIAGVVSILLTLVLWRGSNIWRRIGMGVVVALVAFCTWMARQNYFEWMFHPVVDAQFENEADSKLANSEMVMAIRFGDDARAYPILQMAYHHILNDTVAGVPVAVTY